MNKIKKIVFDGGPCGGKSTALIHTQQKLSDHGIYALVVPEVATELKLAGFQVGVGDVTPLSFQKKVIQRTLENEAFFEFCAEEAPTQSMKVLLLDRALVTGAAYMEPGQYETLLEEQFQMDLTTIRNERYDGVIFLHSVAHDAPHLYTCDNNRARTEGSAEEAQLLNQRTLEAWIGCPKLAVIDNSTDLYEKLNRCFQVVSRFLGLPVPIEDERKFLLKSFDPNKIPVPYQVVQIEQHYVMGAKPKSGIAIDRVRRRGQAGKWTYYHTIKEEIRPGVNFEKERVIDKELFERFLQRPMPGSVPIVKRRFCFIWNDQYFELDYFIEPIQGLCILEHERTEENKSIDLPSFLEIIREVTDDPVYSNFKISQGSLRH